MRKLGFAAALLALAYGGICGYMFVEQRALIYHPTAPRDLPGAERIELKTGGATLRIWARPAAGPAALIYFGGNAEDVANNLERFAPVLADRTLWLVNYRGYGGSTGSPTEQGLFADALAVYDAVHAAHPDTAIIGRSLGTGVAVYLAQQRPVQKLVLVTPYDSIENVARGRYPWLPVGWFIEDKFDSASRIADVKARTLVLLAEDDEVVPRPRADALLAKFPAGPAQVEVIPGSTHNSIGRSPEYAKRIAAFLAR